MSLEEIAWFKNEADKKVLQDTVNKAVASAGNEHPETTDITKLQSIETIDQTVFIEAYRTKLEDISALLIRLRHYVTAKEDIDELQSTVDKLRIAHKGTKYQDFIEKCRQLGSIKKVIREIEESNWIIAKAGTSSALAIIQNLESRIDEIVALKKQFEETAE